MPSKETALFKMPGAGPKKEIKLTSRAKTAHEDVLSADENLRDEASKSLERSAKRIGSVLESERQGEELLGRIGKSKISKGPKRAEIQHQEEQEVDAIIQDLHKTLGLEDGGKEVKNLQREQEGKRANKLIGEDRIIKGATAELRAAYEKRAQAKRGAKETEEKHKVDKWIEEDAAVKKASYDYRMLLGKRARKDNPPETDPESAALFKRIAERKQAKEAQDIQEQDIINEAQNELAEKYAKREKKTRETSDQVRDSLTEAEGTITSKAYKLQGQAEKLLESYKLYLENEQEETDETDDSKLTESQKTERWSKFKADVAKKAKANIGKIEALNLDYPEELSKMKKGLDALAAEARRMPLNELSRAALNKNSELREKIMEALNSSRSRNKMQAKRQFMFGPEIRSEESKKLREAHKRLNYLEERIKNDTGKKPEEAWKSGGWFRFKNFLARTIGRGIYDEWLDAKEEVERLEDEKQIAKAESQAHADREREKTGRSNRISLNPDQDYKFKQPPTSAPESLENAIETDLWEAQNLQKKLDEKKDAEKALQRFKEAVATQAWEKERPSMTIEYAQSLVPEAAKLWEFIAEQAKKKPAAFKAALDDGPTSYVYALARYREAASHGFPQAVNKTHKQLEELNKLLDIENNAYIQALMAKKSWSGPRDSLRGKRQQESRARTANKRTYGVGA